MKKRMKLLQSGDLHVGRGRSSWGQKRSLERASQLFDVLYETAHREKCHGIMLCGDIFDQKNVTNEERELVSRKLTQYAPEMPTYIAPGNHDLKSNTNSNLDFLAEMTENSDEIQNLHVAFAGKEALWLAEPPGDFKCTPLHILGASCPQSESQSWIESRVERIPEGQQIIFMGHATVKGCARNDSNWCPGEDEDKGLSLATASKSDSVLWWAFGDIHKRQKLPTLAEGAKGWYAGSPIQMDFGETPDRGCLIVAFDYDDETKWSCKGQRYVRMDDKGFAPLVTVTTAEQLDDMPDDVLIRLEKGLVLPSARHAQVVTSLVVVDDRSTPAAALSSNPNDGDTDGSAETLEAFDPLMSSLGDVEKEVLDNLPNKGDTIVAAAGRHVVGLAIDRYRERTFVS